MSEDIKFSQVRAALALAPLSPEDLVPILRAVASDEKMVARALDALKTSLER